MMLGNSEWGLKWGLGSWLSWVQPALQIEISTSNSHVGNIKTQTCPFRCTQICFAAINETLATDLIFICHSLCIDWYLYVFWMFPPKQLHPNSVDWIKSHSSICICICLVLPQNPTLIHQISQPSQLNKRCREL